MDADAAVSGDQDPAQTRVPAQLTPFTSATGRAAGLASAERRKALAAVRRRDARTVAGQLDEAVRAFQRQDLGGQCAAAAGWLVAQVVAGHIPVRNADEAAQLLRALVDVARLESGDPTSTALVAHVGATATAQVLALRDQARELLGRGDVVDVDDVTT